jgi:hypothetical protein
MDEWPREIGGHTVTSGMECADCGASFDCFTQFREADCEG